jgi:PAS domain S-box-containing protein
MMAERPVGRVLVIDDSPTNVANIRLELEQVGYEVMTASTGRDGVGAAVTRLPDVVLLDVLMPDIDGYEVCRQIRAAPGTSAVPIVIITGLQGSADRILALEVGANDFLSKPVDSVELLARVRSLVRLKHLNDQLQRQAALTEAAAARERIAAILESITDAFVAVDGQWHFTYINQRAEHMFGRPREEMLGRGFWEHFATTLDSPAVAQSQRAMVERVPVAFESPYPALDAWFEVHVYPGDDGVSFYFHDITTRKRAEEEIHELNALLEQRVRERTAELEVANRQLDDASRMKSEFLASMSHELRTPLNAIIGFSELLQDAKFDDMAQQERSEFLGHIHRSGRHLLDLINDILDLSKVEAGRMELHLETVLLDPLIRGCMAIIQPLALKKQLVVEVACRPPNAVLRADSARIKQVLYNLLSNAVKFTPEGGHISVAAEVDQAGARVAVRDDGVGIKPEDQAAVFEEFRQVGDVSRQQEGTGLGLALVRRLVELHGGRIWLESAPGHGSCFTFSIPAAAAAEVKMAPAGPLSRASAITMSGQHPRKGRQILVVDDERESAELLMLHLSRAGYDVYRASSAEETLAMVRDVQPFAVTLDILMPEHDGWEVLSALRAEPSTRDVPIVVISVVDNPELGFALGATDYLVKPINKDVLLAALRKLELGEPHGG